MRISYDEESHCKLIIDILSNGGDIYKFCTEIGISDRTFYNWKKNHPEFKEAYEIGNTACTQYWIEDLKNNVGNKDLNTPLYTKLLNTKNRDVFSEKSTSTTIGTLNAQQNNLTLTDGSVDEEKVKTFLGGLTKDSLFMLKEIVPKTDEEDVDF